MTTRPSKRAVMEALRDKLPGTRFKLKEAGPDQLGWHHVWVEVYGGIERVIGTLHATPAKTIHGTRENMIALAESFVGRAER
ncbi:MAG TPA: hypothetical protein VGK73_31500 [Polyangiaceae bacterium]